MSTFDEPDPWDEIKAQLASLEVGPTEPIVNVQTLTDQELLVRKEAIKQELFERGEALSPKTQTGRDLHGTRAAIVIELHRRHLL